MLDLMTWTATGLGVGWLARRLLRSRRDFGLAGDLVTGWLGGLLGGWLFRRAGIVAPEAAVGHVVVSVAGAIALLAGLRLLRHLAFAAHAATQAVAMPDPKDLGERIRRLGDIERRVLQAVLARDRVATDPNRAFEERITFGQRVADRVALFGGSWTFIGLFAIVLIGWIALNQQTDRPFDPYPFILLNLILSCLAALQAPVIMMSQNRQAAKDRSDARSDYEVNVRAEMEITALHSKIDLLREQEMLRLVTLVEAQARSLAEMHRRLDGLDARPS